MIKYEIDYKLIVYAEGENEFTFKCGEYFRNFNRKQLTELRHIIDKALNTSAEELGDVE